MSLRLRDLWVISLVERVQAVWMNPYSPINTFNYGIVFVMISFDKNRLNIRGWESKLNSGWSHFWSALIVSGNPGLYRCIHFSGSIWNFNHLVLSMPVSVLLILLPMACSKGLYLKRVTSMDKCACVSMRGWDLIHTGQDSGVAASAHTQFMEVFLIGSLYSGLHRCQPLTDGSIHVGAARPRCRWIFFHWAIMRLGYLTVWAASLHVLEISVSYSSALSFFHEVILVTWWGS